MKTKTYSIKKIINHVEYKATVMNQSHHSFPFTPKQEDWRKKEKHAAHVGKCMTSFSAAAARMWRSRAALSGEKKTFGWRKKLSGALVHVSNNGSTWTVASYFGYLMLGEVHRQGPVTGSPSDLQRQEVWGSCLLALTRGACCGKDASLIL